MVIRFAKSWIANNHDLDLTLRVTQLGIQVNPNVRPPESYFYHLA